MVEKFWTRSKDEGLRQSPAVFSQSASVEIEYPVEGERILAGHYAVRIAAEMNSHVEVSIDAGPWQACRFSVGNYWYDWNPNRTGVHRIVVRSRAGDGPRKTSKERSCTVTGSEKR